MGLVKFGGGVAGISGKVGGTVYARNAHGAYARNWAVPINPGTPRQSDVRLQFAAASAAYSMLSAAQVDSWAAYGLTITRLNRQGDTYHPSGRQVYIECFQNAMQGLLPHLDAPSAYSNSPSIMAIGAIVSTAVADLLTVLTVADVTVMVPSGADGVVIFEAAPIHKTSLRNVNNQFRQIFATAATGGPFDLKPGYIAVFGNAAPAGQVISLRVRVVDDTSCLGSSTMLVNDTI